MTKTRVLVAALWSVVAMACGGAPQQQPEQQPEQQAATLVSSEQELGQVCGSVACAAGTWCCNASCSRCVPKGMQCTQEACADEGAGTQAAPEPEEANLGEACGKTTCTGKTYCCNASCSLCTPFDVSCTQQVCDDGT